MSTVKTSYWHKISENKVGCDLCPRECKLSEGQRGFCFVRGCEEGEVVLHTYGRSSGFCIDPIEKKPLNHFYPGTPILSFGTAGCNLGCKFCQNWDISKSRQMDSMQSEASPEDVVGMAKQHGAKSIAFTYNDPVIFLEYARDVAEIAHEENLKTVAVTAGYIQDEARRDFFSFIDAANIDLKSFSEKFYVELTGGHLQPVLDTLEYVKKETECWLEITTLLIPGKNDSPEEIDAMTKWIKKHLSPDVPLHFTAFHPDYKLRDIPRTTLDSLERARGIAKMNGLHHVYTGNVHDSKGGSTYCAGCGELLIERDWYELSTWNLDQNGRCKHCRQPLSGHFDGEPGRWGAKRQPIFI